MLVFSPTESPQQVDSIGRRSPIECHMQGYNKQVCWLEFHAIASMLSTKQGSCECKYQKSPIHRYSLVNQRITLKKAV